MSNWKRCTLLLVLSGLLAMPALAGTLTLVPSQDNTLYEVQPNAIEGNGGPPSNGAGEYLFAGTTAFAEARRGLMAFDIAGALPDGAVVTEVTLTLEMSRTIAGPETVSLHRVTNDWGEGASDAPGEEGGGTPAADGDATWLHTFYPSGFWTTPGGDFSGASSASQTIDTTGSYTWGSTPEMVADVQAWLDDPSSNFGWILIGNESSSVTAKRFNTRENGTGAPQLAIVFQEPVPTLAAWWLAALAISLLALAGWKLGSRRQSVRTPLRR